MKLVKVGNRWHVLSVYSERGLVPRQENGKSFFVWNYRESPGVWSTDRARVAAMLAEYADDETRQDIEKRAREEADPDVATLLFDGATYRYYSPISMNDAARDAGFDFTREPSPAHWHTQDPDRAVKCYQIAQHYEGFTCPAAIQMVLQAHLEAQQAHIEASRVVGLDVDLPRPVGLDYFPYQKAAIVYGMQRQRVLFGDSMGLGKTIEALGLVNALHLRHVLIVCPATLKLNWMQEAEKWLVDGQRVGIATSKAVPFGADIVIVNFESLGRKEKSDLCLGCEHPQSVHVEGGLFPCRMVGEHCQCVEFVPSPAGDAFLRPELDREWDMLIVDECHRIKNEKTARAKLTFSIRAKRSAFLSGTPIPNKPKELWTLLNHLAPETFSKQWDFWKTYCGASRSNGWNKDGASNLDELQNKMRAAVMIRRLLEEVWPEMPRKRRQVLEFPAGALVRFVSAEQDAVKRRAALELELRTQVELTKASDDPEEHKAAVAALKQGMKVAFSEMAKLRHDTAVAKIPLVIQHVENVLESEPKYVIFAHHIDVIEALIKHFGKSAVAVYGDVSPVERIARKDRFNEDLNCRLFIGGIFVAGVGLSLRCSKLGFAELDWVPGNVTQCEDRCHGVGRGIEGEPLLVQHLMLEGSLDANMARTIVSKQEIADRALDRRESVEPEPLDPAFEFDPDPVVLGEKREAIAPEEVADLPSTHGATPEWIVKTAEKLSGQDVVLIYRAVRQLAGLCDGAFARDGSGFNAYDAKLGHTLAAKDSLSQKESALALRLCRKYNTSQLGGLLDSLYGDGS